MSTENEFFDDVQRTAPAAPEEATAHSQQEVDGVETIAKKRKANRMLDPENYIQLNWFARNGRFLMYLFLIVILYIYNNHYAVKTQFSIKKLDEEIKELNSEYIILKSEIMHLSKQSEVAKMVASDSLKIISTPPIPLAPFEIEKP